MTLRKRVESLVELGGYDVIPGFIITSVHKGIDVELKTEGKFTAFVEFSDEYKMNTGEDNFGFGTYLIEEKDIISTEKLERLDAGIIIIRSSECLSQWKDPECECPVCRNGYTYNVIFKYGVIKTKLNAEIYEDLAKVLGCTCEEILDKLKKVYLDMVIAPLNVELITRLSQPYAITTYVDERTSWYALLCNPENKYTEDTFIQSAFDRSLDRVKNARKKNNK